MIQSSSSSDCYVIDLEFDLSTIPTGAIITDVSLLMQNVADSGFIAADEKADIRAIDFDDLSSRTGAERFASISGSGTDYYNEYDLLSTGDITVILNSNAITEVQAEIDSGDKVWALGIWAVPGTQSAGNEYFQISSATHADPTSIEITYNFLIPDAVDDLISTDITQTTADLSWSTPNLNGGNLTDGYQINYTTPNWGAPTLVITNDTTTSDTTAIISSLIQNQNYSFRVSAWNEFGNNITGATILNITTLEDFTIVNYTVGSFDFNATNPDVLAMLFERQDINSTALFLNITYPNTYDLACDLAYEYANINQTYTNLSNVTITATTIESSFLFVDVDNEIITVYCWDQSNLANDGQYLITQTQFLMLDQISGFQTGAYGTDGNIGVLDLVTMLVIIFSFVGLNKVNEAVGGVFAIIVLGVTAYFGIIELPTVIFGGIAIVLMLIVTSVRKK